ncbi:MAG TPA: hypothetical protein VFI25_16345 [Planctomycetota bacterium]|nr:hypothetical protein [Planctomycetota bacterium]
MRRLLFGSLRLAGIVALLLALPAAGPLGASSPDFLLAAAVALAARRRDSFAAGAVLLGGVRASLSVDPVLPTLGGFLLIAEGSSLAAGTFFGERAFVPGLCAAASAILLPLLRCAVPGGTPLAPSGDLLLSACGTGLVAAVLARWVFTAARARR